jgi:polysaccharide biosynthesis protein PslH
MRKPMNILFLVPYVPNLIRVRPYNLIRHLSEQGHRLTLVTLWTGKSEQKDIQHLEQICQQVYSARLPVSRSLLNSLLALPTRLPLQANYCWQPSLKKQFQQLFAAQENPFDIVHVEHLRGVRYALDLRNRVLRGQPVPIIWDSVDSISMLFKQAAGRSESLFGRMLGKFELGRTERYEGWLVNQFEKILVTSQLDKNAYISLNPDAGEAVNVLPNGVDLDYFSPDPSFDREPDTLVLSGKMSYHANVTMAIHLVEKIMPLIWEKRPGVKVYIVGKDPAKEIKTMGKDTRVLVTGTVDDIRPYLRRASISVTPILYGAGIQNKVLEAMACATPVVSTPQAVSALSLKTGQDVITAQDPRDFAQAVLCLLDNPSLQGNVGEAGRRYVESNHRWGKIVEDLVDLYSQEITKRGNKSGQFN